MKTPDPLGADPANLEFPLEAMQAMSNAVVARALSHVASVSAQPSCGDMDTDALCRSLREAAPEPGAPLEPLLDLLFDLF